MLDQLGSVMSTENLDTMRAVAEENSKLFLQTANHTINLWPAVIFISLLLVVLPYLLPLLLSAYGQLYYKSDHGHHQPHRSGDYEDYGQEELEYNDNWRSQLLRRRRMRARARKVELDEEELEGEEGEDYPHYYSDDWKTSSGDYKYWNRQTRDLETGQDQGLVRNMVVGLADRVSNAVRMIQ